MTQTNAAINVKFRFEASSEKTARLTIERADSRFGLRSRTPYEYTLGLDTKPLYKIRLPDTPVDDRLEVSPLPLGELVPDGAGDLGEAAAAYRVWSAGSAATRGERVISVLPAGQYYLVRTARRAVSGKEITMGNEIVESPPGVLTLLESERFYSYIFGPSPTQPPKLDTPMVGVPVLNYIGSGNTHGVIFFSCAADALTAPHISAAETVLIIPVSGSLILNVKVFWPREENERDSKLWSEALVDQFARAVQPDSRVPGQVQPRPSS